MKTQDVKLNKSKKQNAVSLFKKLRLPVILGLVAILSTLLIYSKNAAPSTSEVTLTDATFDQVVLKSNKLVMVDFWATWCGPCRRLAPTVKQIADENKGKLIVGKLDVDQNQNTAIKYQIQSIPTILFFKNGKVVDQVMGAVPKEVLDEKIKKYSK